MSSKGIEKYAMEMKKSEMYWYLMRMSSAGQCVSKQSLESMMEVW